MWFPKKLPNNKWEVIHSNGQKATQVEFTSDDEAKKIADLYNKTNLGFCPTCDRPQNASEVCSACVLEALNRNPTVLDGRLARCQCGCYIASYTARERKMFFQYNPNLKNDHYWCGCGNTD